MPTPAGLIVSGICLSLIALADLVPELTTSPSPHARSILTVGSATGLALLLALTAIGSTRTFLPRTFVPRTRPFRGTD